MNGAATEAKSLGDYFVKSIGDNASVLSVRGGKFDAGEFKAPATQTTTSTATIFQPIQLHMRHALSDALLAG